MKRVKKHIKEFMHKAFQPFSSNTKLWHEDYLYPILEAARSLVHVENTGNKADSLHRRIKLSYEEDLQAAYMSFIKHHIKLRRFTSALISIDFTDEEFYGEESSLWIIPWTGEQGVTGKYRFAVMSMVNKEAKKKLPLLAIPTYVGINKGDMVKLFLDFAHKLFSLISGVLLDAGFYAGEVVRALGNERYVIRAPKNKKVKRFIKKTKREAEYTDEIKWNSDKTWHKVKTKYIIVRKVKFKGKLIDCTFITNMSLKPREYLPLYRCRWQIETNFRVEDYVRIKSRSKLTVVRYFYFLLQLLLHAIWILFFREKMAFEKFKVYVGNYFFCEYIGVRYSVVM